MATSADGTPWQTPFTTTTGDGGTDDMTVATDASAGLIDSQT